MGSDEAEVARLISDAKEDWQKDAFKREAPRHQVELDAFALAKYPTTNAMFRCFLEAGGYADERWWAEAKAAKVWRPDGTVKDWWGDVRNRPASGTTLRFNSPSQPVVGVTWYEAVAYCRWLTATLSDGYVYRLPTEAEWERAARGPPSPPSPAAAGGGAAPSGEGAARYPWGRRLGRGLVQLQGAGPGAHDAGRHLPAGRQRRRGARPGRQRLGVVQRLVRRDRPTAGGRAG